MRRLLLALFAAIPVAFAAWACGTDAVGVEACRQIEEARCKVAPNCGVSLAKPVHRDSPQTDIDACISFYRDECLHGLSTPTDPGQVAVQACVDAINRGNCDVLKHPEIDPSCAFLIPPAPAPTPDAGADVVDAGIDVLTDASSTDNLLPDVFTISL
jgi:hypothetical protein